MAVQGHVYQAGALEVMDRLMPPPGWVPTAAERRAHYLRRFMQAFTAGGAMGCYEWRPSQDLVDPGDRTHDPVGPEIAHGEWRHGYAHWDPPQLAPPPSLVTARTPCMSDDLGRTDDVEFSRPDHRAYLCRFRHVHNGLTPYGSDIPAEVRGRISAWLGEVA